VLVNKEINKILNIYLILKKKISVPNKLYNLTRHFN